MKKGLFRALAITLSAVMMLAVCIITTVSAEEVVTDYTTLLPAGYEAADKIYDVANEENSRVISRNNWKYWGGSAAYPTLEDQYGLTRVGADYAYLDIAVENATEYFAVGMMVHKSFFQNGKCENYYYISVDGENWKAVLPLGTATPETSPHYSLNFADTDYRFEVDVIGSFPEDTKYFRAVTFCPTAAWTPILDFVNIYDAAEVAPVQVEFDTALNGCDGDSVKTYFDDTKTIADLFSEDEYYGVTLGDRAGIDIGYRTTAGKEWGIYVSADKIQKYTDHLSGPYFVIPVSDDGAIETGHSFTSTKGADYGLVYYASSDKENWTRIPDTCIASVEYTAETEQTYATIPSAMLYRRQRLTNLPEGTKYVKMYIYNTGWWDVILDYVDVYDSEERFEEIFSGYSDKATTTYFDDSNTNHSDVVTFNNVTVGGKGMGNRAGGDWSATATSTADAWISIPVTDANVVETAVRISNDYASKIGLVFYESANNVDWVKVSNSNVAITKEPTNTAYPVEKYRVANLSKDTRYLKISFDIVNTWAQTLDYVDVFEVNPFYTAFEGKEIYSANVIEGFVDPYKEKLIGYENVANGTTTGSTIQFRNVEYLGVIDKNYFKLSADSTEAYVAFLADSTKLIETTSVFDNNHLGSMKVEFMYSENTDNSGWVALPDKCVTKSNGITKKPDGTSLGNYTAYTYRLTDLPENTKSIKIVFGTRAWAPTIDYIDIFDTVHTHTFGEWLYNPIKHTVEKFCEDDYTFVVKGNIADTEEVRDTLDILDIVRLNAFAGGADFDIELDVADTDESGVIDLADLTWIRNFILRKIYG